MDEKDHPPRRFRSLHLRWRRSTKREFLLLALGLLLAYHIIFRSVVGDVFDEKSRVKTVYNINIRRHFEGFVPEIIRNAGFKYQDEQVLPAMNLGDTSVLSTSDKRALQQDLPQKKDGEDDFGLEDDGLLLDSDESANIDVDFPMEEHQDIKAIAEDHSINPDTNMAGFSSDQDRIETVANDEENELSEDENEEHDLDQVEHEGVEGSGDDKYNGEGNEIASETAKPLFEIPAETLQAIDKEALEIRGNKIEDGASEDPEESASEDPEESAEDTEKEPAEYVEEVDGERDRSDVDEYERRDDQDESAEEEEKEEEEGGEEDPQRQEDPQQQEDASVSTSNFNLLLMHTQRNHDDLSEAPFLPGMENDEPAYRAPCKDVSFKSDCAELSHCMWSDELRKCRTETWAMTCKMTQVKSTCLKVKGCVWMSKSKLKGRYCVDAPQEPEVSEEAAGNAESEETATHDESSKKSCRKMRYKSLCVADKTCFWSETLSGCRTQYWAMTCDSTQIKDTCKKISHCKWSSKDKERGRFCKDKPTSPPTQEPVEGEESAPTEKPTPAPPKCRKIPVRTLCEEQESCEWSEDGRGCRFMLSKMTCSMTQIKATCLSLANCTWTAPNSRRSRGRYCEQKPDEHPSSILALALAGQLANATSVEMHLKELSRTRNETEVLEEHSRLSRTRLGNRTVLLYKCKLLKTQPYCQAFDHCSWGSSGCVTTDEFLPCTSTALRSRCDNLRHCVWSAKGKSRGKYCFDKYFMDNPEELDTRCTKIRASKECEAQVACEWRSTTKSKGKFCERQVSMAKAEAELGQLFPSPNLGLYHAKPGAINRTTFVEDSDSILLGVGCAKNIECQSPEALARLFSISEKTFVHQTSYQQSRCCHLHDDYQKMVAAGAKHFAREKFSDWFLDKELLVGMMRFQGSIPPWTRKAAISVVAKSSRTIESLMQSFNEGFQYRPYAINACASASKSSCKSLQKFPPKKKIHHYSMQHMDTETGPYLEIYPLIIAKTDKRCVFLNDGKPVPLSFVTPPVRCPYPMYGTTVQCPAQVNALLDLEYGNEWRAQPFVQDEQDSPDWASDQAKSIQPEQVNIDSDLRAKLFFLRKYHCPTL